VNRLLYINEREDQHCAEIFPLNLVKLDRRPDKKDSTIELTCLVNPSRRPQRCFHEPDRITGCFRMTKGPAVRVGLIAYTASEQSQGCLSTLQGSWQREDTRPVITKAACELKAEKGSRLYKRLDSQSVLIDGSGDVADSAGEFRRYKQVRTKLKPSGPSFKAFWQKSRRVRRLNQDSGPYMARHEKRTRTVGIQHGKSRRYV